jgi:hypothetical protein
MTIEAKHNAWHQIADDNHVRNAYSKALDSNSSIKHDRSLRVRNLRKGKKGRRSSVKVTSAFRLEIKTKGSGQARPYYQQDTKHNPHVRQN